MRLTALRGRQELRRTRDNGELPLLFHHAQQFAPACIERKGVDVGGTARIKILRLRFGEMQEQMDDQACNAALRITLCCSFSEEIAVILRCSALYEAILNALGNAIDLGQCGAVRHEEEVTQKVKERIFLRQSSRMCRTEIVQYRGHEALAELCPRRR